MKARLKQAKEQRLEQLNDLLTQTTEQMSELELAAQNIHTKVNEEENPETLTVSQAQLTETKFKLEIKHKISVFRRKKIEIMRTEEPTFDLFFFFFFRELKVSLRGEFRHVVVSDLAS